MTEDRLYDTKCGCTLPLKVAATTLFFSNLYMGTQCFLQGWITRVAVPQMLAQAIPGIYMLKSSQNPSEAQDMVAAYGF